VYETEHNNEGYKPLKFYLMIFFYFEILGEKQIVIVFAAFLAVRFSLVCLQSDQRLQRVLFWRARAGLGEFVK